MRFINAPFVNEEQTIRAQWPRATMTHGENRLFREGWAVHRDATTEFPVHVETARGSTLYPSFGRMRQDAPAGSGSVLLYSPTALDASRRGFRLPVPVDRLDAGIPSLAATMRGGLAPLPSAPVPAPEAEIPRTPRWDPMRARPAALTAEATMRNPLAAPRLNPEPWQVAVRQSFPRCTGHDVRVDKAQLAKTRAAERWAARLNEMP